MSFFHWQTLRLQLRLAAPGQGQDQLPGPAPAARAPGGLLAGGEASVIDPRAWSAESKWESPDNESRPGPDLSAGHQLRWPDSTFPVPSAPLGRPACCKPERWTRPACVNIPCSPRPRLARLRAASRSCGLGLLASTFPAPLSPASSWPAGVLHWEQQQHFA